MGLENDSFIYYAFSVCTRCCLVVNGCPFSAGYGHALVSGVGLRDPRRAGHAVEWYESSLLQLAGYRRIDLGNGPTDFPQTSWGCCPRWVTVNCSVLSTTEVMWWNGWIPRRRTMVPKGRRLDHWQLLSIESCLTPVRITKCASWDLNYRYSNNLM